MAARVPASTARDERPSRQVSSSVSAALHQVCTLLRCHLNAGVPARPIPAPPISCAASRRWPTLSARLSRQSRTGPADADADADPDPFFAPLPLLAPHRRPTYADAARARSALTDSAARASSRGLRGGGDPPYDARLCSHTDGYCVVRHDLRTKSLAAGDAADTSPAAAAAAAASSRRRGAAAATLRG
uniref:Uncharacterized protein n=1 Tax=Zea mays TaxID=4577 RepID=B6SGS0_MAIZE|nr:hypothetical protein [Zea mays]